MSNVFNFRIRTLKSILLLIFFSIPVYFAIGNDETVSDRELLLLSIVTYHDIQGTDVSEIKDKNFEKKWFAGHASISELKGWEIVDSVINKNVKKMAGLSVITYKKGKNVVIAFRGTDSGFIRENWGYFISKHEHPQAKYVAQYINSLRKASFIDDDTNIYLTGHSLGGYLAIFALGVITGIEDLKGKLVKAVTFSGLGIGYLKDKAMKERLNNIGEDKLVNYAVKGDVIAQLGKHFTKIIYVKFILRPLKSLVGFLSITPHYPYSFFVQGSPFKNSSVPCPA